jgi:hypothetical protein
VRNQASVVVAVGLASLQYILDEFEHIVQVEGASAAKVSIFPDANLQLFAALQFLSVDTEAEQAAEVIISEV